MTNGRAAADDARQSAPANSGSAGPVTPGFSTSTQPSCSPMPFAGWIDATNSMSSRGPPNAHIDGFDTGSSIARSSRPPGVKRSNRPASFARVQ